MSDDTKQGRTRGRNTKQVDISKNATLEELSKRLRCNVTGVTHIKAGFTFLSVGKGLTRVDDVAKSEPKSKPLVNMTQQEVANHFRNDVMVTFITMSKQIRGYLSKGSLDRSNPDVAAELAALKAAI